MNALLFELMKRSLIGAIHKDEIVIVVGQEENFDECDGVVVLTSKGLIGTITRAQAEFLEEIDLDSR